MRQQMLSEAEPFRQLLILDARKAMEWCLRRSPNFHKVVIDSACRALTSLIPSCSACMLARPCRIAGGIPSTGGTRASSIPGRAGAAKGCLKVAGQGSRADQPI